MRKDAPLATGTLEAPRRNRRDTLLLFVICTLMWGTNSLYIINMPLFIINELHLPEKLAGVMMGTAAGLEIPTMLIAGYFAKRLGKRLLMCIAVVAGLCFYAGMLLAHAPATLLGLQLLNAIYIGILGGIGMLYFQDLMRAGQVQPPRCIPIPFASAGSLPVRWRESPQKSGITMRSSGLR